VTVRGGKGNKFRQVRLNVDGRKAIQAYLGDDWPTVATATARRDYANSFPMMFGIWCLCHSVPIGWA